MARSLFWRRMNGIKNSLIARLAGALNADPLRHAKDCVTASPDGARQPCGSRPGEDDLEMTAGAFTFPKKFTNSRDDILGSMRPSWRLRDRRPVLHLHRHSCQTSWANLRSGPCPILKPFAKKP